MSAAVIPAWEDMDLPTRIRVLLALRNITCSDLAVASGLCAGTVSRLAFRGKTPKLETMQRLAASLEVELTDLVPPMEVES